MNNKIIGFTISPFAIDHSQIDIFDTGLELITIKHHDFFIYFWGIGDLEKCKISLNKWTLSFPLHHSLEDRNVLISISDHDIIIENDWLGSIPVYYHEKKRIISTNINLITNNCNKTELHSEGTNNYLEFGFSILEQTPIKNIKFLRYYSSLIVKSSKIEIDYKKDVAIEYIDKKTNVETVLNDIQTYVQNVENITSGEIIIPTSGGYDSRLLNGMISNKKRITSFTYGISQKQKDSYEVVKAEKVSKNLKTKWKFISLGKFNEYYQKWYEAYGPAIHLHGMYHIEFYKKISEHVQKPASWLSGIIGDAWSGKFDIPKVKTTDDLINIGYVHSIGYPVKYSLLPKQNSIRQNFINTNKDYLKNAQYRIITAMRFKIILLAYLMSLPDYFGFASWTPMLNLKHAVSMLNLPNSERNNRKWQTDFFKKNNIYIENEELQYNKNNDLNATGLKNFVIPEIDCEALQKIIQKKALIKLNKQYSKLAQKPFSKPCQNILLQKRYIGEILRRLKIKPIDHIKPYNQLLILKSLEMLLKKNDQK